MHTATHNERVLETLASHQPEVCIVDVDMAGMSGYSIAREILENHGGSRPTLVGLSSTWHALTSGRVLAATFGHYLAKPPDPRALVAILEEVRARRARGIR